MICWHVLALLPWVKYSNSTPFLQCVLPFPNYSLVGFWNSRLSVWIRIQRVLVVFRLQMQIFSFFLEPQHSLLVVWIPCRTNLVFELNSACLGSAQPFSKTFALSMCATNYHLVPHLYRNTHSRNETVELLTSIVVELGTKVLLRGQHFSQYQFWRKLAITFTNTMLRVWFSIFEDKAYNINKLALLSPRRWSGEWLFLSSFRTCSTVYLSRTVDVTSAMRVLQK